MLTGETMLASVTFSAAYRTFAEGEQVAFDPLTLLVGGQGAGKSSLLLAIRSITKESTKKIVGYDLVGPAMKMRFFDFEKDNVRVQSAFSNAASIMPEITARFRSHGEVVLPMLEALALEAEQKQYGLIAVLDEPDASLHPRSVLTMNAIFDRITTSGSQVIASVHNPLAIAGRPRVFDVERREWISGDEYLEKYGVEVRTSHSTA